MLKKYYKIIRLFESLLNILIVCILNLVYLFRKTSLPRRKYDTIQILGNGPSLDKDISQILSKRKNKSLMAVNGFASSNLFVKLKPDYYIIVDSGVFIPTFDKRLKEFQDSTIKGLIENTKWEMILFVPFSAKKSYFINKLDTVNPFINIVYLKNIPLIGGSQRINSLLFTSNMANPAFNNVLVASIFTSLNMDFKKIILWGADHSWYEDYVLGKDNYIYRTDRHFNNESRLIKMSKPDGSPVKLHEEFFNMSQVLKAYEVLKKVSIMKKCKIVNLSSKTFIGAFDRQDK